MALAVVLFPVLLQDRPGDYLLGPLSIPVLLKGTFPLGAPGMAEPAPVVPPLLLADSLHHLAFYSDLGSLSRNAVRVPVATPIREPTATSLGKW